MSGNLQSVMPLDAGPRREDTAVRNICYACSTRWWTSGGAAERCPKCGASFIDRDAWKAEPFYPERLTEAREARGLHLHDLAAKIAGMPFAEFESGTRVPTKAELLQIARALALPPGFFTRSIPPSVKENGPFFWCERAEDCYRWDECVTEAVAACDFPLAGGGTCDRAICAMHGKRIGDDLDYCAEHAGMPERAEVTHG